MSKNKIGTFLSWGLYEWASSAYFSIIQTFIFSVYFIQHVASSEITGNSQWGLAMGLSGIVIAFTAPVLGTVADQVGHRKKWLALFTLICVIATAFLWNIKPSSDYAFEALLLLAVGSISAELAFVFYNAMLPDLAPPGKIGLWSGLGWGLGYIGGVICLIISFLLTKGHPIHYIFAFVAFWYLLFSLPLFMVIPESMGKGKKLAEVVKNSIFQLKSSFKTLIVETAVLRFLIARMFYIDGLTSLFAFGGIFVAEVYRLNTQDILIFAIILNISAGIGSFLFSWLDDIIGSKKLILICLANLILLISLILMVHSLALFWILAVLLGLFVGPLQASSRSFMAKIIPKKLENEMFGFFAFSGKATTFLGPLFISGITYLTSSLYAGFATILFFFVIGMGLMLTVPSENDLKI